ncbi:hypothetical protein B0H19DRAFT_1258740 [Mycena capillaripes]|nr:hypothetical protein B0H19DRAFT_1258740 [Mycena capillaripes]
MNASKELLQQYKDQITRLEEQATEAKRQHENIVTELIEKAGELKYQLSIAQGERADADDKLYRNQEQLYNVRKLVVDVAARLAGRERLKSNDSVEGQLAETKRFIMSICGQLQDGVKGVVERAKRRNRVAGSD